MASNGIVSERNLLVLQLTQSQQLLRELLAYLDQPNNTSSCKSLASEILSSIDRAISMAKSSTVPVPRSSNQGSPCSENSGDINRQAPMSKKRKTLPKWTCQVAAGGNGEGVVDGPLDDGHSWRKYGQKGILGARYPRGYYRCTHRNTRSCPATKQVQRSDTNPSAFDVTYRGAHTCHQRLQSQSGVLKVDVSGQEVSCVLPEPSVDFSPLSTLEENCFNGGFSTSFVSPATSESNYYAVSPCVQIGESLFAENIMNSSADSQMVNTDFMLEQLDFDFDPDFPFDTSAFFA